MEEFETSVSHVQTELQSGEEKSMISAVEEGKSKEHIMPGRGEKEQEWKTESFWDCM